MATVIEHAVADRERPLANEVVLVIDGLRLRITRGDTAAHRRSARASGAARTTRSVRSSRRRFVDLLVARYKEALIRNFRDVASASTRRVRRWPTADNVTSIFDRDTAPDPTVAGALARGEAPPEGWEPELRARLRAPTRGQGGARTMWPVLSGAELVNDLFGFTALVAVGGTRRARPTTSRRCCTAAASRDVAARARGPRPTSRSIDEADALLGPVEAAAAAAAPPAPATTRSTPRRA